MDCLKCGLCLLLLCIPCLSMAQSTDPAPSPVLAFEGRLIEGSGPVSGVHAFDFRVMDASGAELWKSGLLNLTVSGGLYGVVLGTGGMPAMPESLAAKNGLHLNVSVDGAELSPDVPLIPTLQASSAWKVTGTFSGDVSGTQQAMSVEKLRGWPLDVSMSPSAGQVLLFNGSSWVASSLAEYSWASWSARRQRVARSAWDTRSQRQDDSQRDGGPYRGDRHGR